MAELWECHRGGDIHPALVPADFGSEVMLSGVPAVTEMWSSSLELSRMNLWNRSDVRGGNSAGGWGQAASVQLSVT